MNKFRFLLSQFSYFNNNVEFHFFQTMGSLSQEWATIEPVACIKSSS